MATKTTSMTLRVSPHFKRMLDQAAKREQRSRTNFLEKLVADHCRSIGMESGNEGVAAPATDGASSREEM